MRALILIFGVLGSAASAQQLGPGQPATPVKPIVIKEPIRTNTRVIDPRVTPEAANLLPIALGQSQWARVDTIDGKRRPVRLRPGQTIVIRGSGFGEWGPADGVTLFPGTTDIGAPFAIEKWVDTAIVAVVPPHHALLAHSLTGRLYISGAATLRGAQIRTKTEVFDVHLIVTP